MKFFNYQRQEIDLYQHCLQQRTRYGSDLYVFIGTDSISVGGKVHYFTTIAFRHSKTGVHFIFSKEKVPTFRKGDGKPDIFTKLWKEAELTINLCENLVENNIFNRNQIIVELDYNNVSDTLSRPLIPATRGWAIGLGYQVLTKYGEKVLCGLEWVDEQIACKAANHLCQGVSN